MDDLTSKINQILSDPESLNQIKNIAASLGLGGASAPAQPQQQSPSATPAPQPQYQQPQPPQNPPPAQQQPQATAPQNNTQMPDLSALAALLSGQQNKPPPPQNPPLIDPATLGIIATALSRLNNTANDKNIDLLRALKPHFSDSRSSKVDDAIRIIQLLSLLPIIRETGLFSGLFGGDKK